MPRCRFAARRSAQCPESGQHGRWKMPPHLHGATWLGTADRMAGVDGARPLVTGSCVSHPPPVGRFCAYASLSPTATVTAPIARNTPTPKTADSILALPIVESAACGYRFTCELSNQNL